MTRPGAYGVTFETARGSSGVLDGAARLLVVRGRRGWFLPGGGLERGESPEEGLRREFAEEVGLPLEVGELIGEAGQFVSTASEGVILKEERFYRVVLPGDAAASIVDGHRGGEGDEVAWLERRASPGLHEEVQRWAVRIARGSAG